MNLDNFQVCDRDLSDDLLSRYLGVNSIAVDTETMGLVPGRDRLCLIQLSVISYQGNKGSRAIGKSITNFPPISCLLSPIF